MGTRLKELTGDLPKPLYPIEKKSPLERQCEFLKLNGINSLIWICGYKKQLFEDFSNLMSEKYALEIELISEKNPLGECGRLKNHHLDEKESYIFSAEILYLK